METEKKKVSKSQAYFMLVVSILVVVIGFMLTDETEPVVLLFAGAVSAIMAVIFGVSYKEIQSGIVTLVRNMIIPIIIIFSVGMMIGSWMLSGTVPIMIYYGMQIANPSIFYFMACLICAVMALCMGSSWGTISTLGIAFLGIATGLGLSIPITAGAVACGALFGDKLSPMSDSPIVATTVSSVNIIEGCLHCAKTTGPALVISLIYYLLLGFFHPSVSAGNIDTGNYEVILNGLSAQYSFNPLLLLPPLVVVILIILKKPTLPTFAAGIALGCMLAVIFQGASINDLANALTYGYTESAGNEIVDSILNRGGLNSFLSIAALLIAACSFGAPLRVAGVVDVLLDLISGTSKSAKSMAVKVYGMCLTFFVITGGYDLTYTVLGPMLPGLFDKYQLHRKNLTRILQDCTISLSPLVPWGAMGAFFAGTLGVSNLTFLIYAPLTWLSPLIGLIYIFTGFTMTKSPGPDKDVAAVSKI